MIKDTKTIVAIAVVAILIVAGVGVGIAAANSNKNVKHDDIKDMSWDEIVDAAKGTDVKASIFFDAYCTKWFNDIVIPLAKERYDINLTNVGYRTDVHIVNEWKADPNAKCSFDFIWGRSSNLAGLMNVDSSGTCLVLQSNWQDKMPNMALSDTLAEQGWQNAYDGAYGAGKYSKDVCSVAPFSGSTTSFIFNKDFNDSSIKWNEVKVSITNIVDGKPVVTDTVIKVAATGDAFDKNNIDTSKTYGLDSVRAVCRDGVSTDITCRYGLPHDFTELASWVVLYPYQIYIPSATSALVNFHTQLILEAMVYELASKNEAGTEWVACTDSSAYVWSHDLNGKFKTGDDAANKATYKAYIEEKILGVKTAAEYGAVVPYLKAYLDTIMPYLNQQYTATTGAVTEPNSNLIGNLAPAVDYNDTPANPSLMIALSTVESVAVRSGDYNVKIGIYMLDTACSNRCGIFIPSTTGNAAGAIVIANLMNDPYVQATYYNIAGNGFNMDLEKLNLDQKLYFTSYIDEWTLTGKPFIAPDDVAKSRTIASIGYKEALLSEYADPFIKKTP